MTTSTSLPFASRLVNSLLSIQPLAAFAKRQARDMMIQRAEAIGVYWRKEVATLQARDWAADLAAVEAPNFQYPEYYLTSFHAYEEGNLGWNPAFEVEVASYAVHARLWPDAGASGDGRLRHSFLEVLRATVPTPPSAIVDIGCSVGMSTFALQELYPQAQITGVDLSPYFLAVAHYRAQQRRQTGQVEADDRTGSVSTPQWLHAAGEATGLPDRAYDLVSAFLVVHEMPESATIALLQEARRLLRPGGYLAIMDMNPQAETFRKMPPYILTLLKSTEPYLDQYFGLDFAAAVESAGFERPTITENSPRHRTIIARAGS